MLQERWVRQTNSYRSPYRLLKNNPWTRFSGSRWEAGGGGDLLVKETVTNVSKHAYSQGAMGQFKSSQPKV